MKPKWVAVFDFDGTCISQTLGSVYDFALKNGLLMGFWIFIWSPV